MTIKTTLSALLIFTSVAICAQNPKVKTEEFKVWGNCGMCKKTIERAASEVKGVKKATWDTESKKMTLSYDPSKTSVENVQKAIAAVGYDTPLATGNSEAYGNLHGCCQYERK